MKHIYVVGIGPGAYEKMTIEAAEALKTVTSSLDIPFMLIW